MREPSRSAISPEAEARLLEVSTARGGAGRKEAVVLHPPPVLEEDRIATNPITAATPFAGSLLQKKKRDRLLLVSFRMPQGLKEKLEEAAKKHELNQTDLINEAIELNLQRYL